MEEYPDFLEFLGLKPSNMNMSRQEVNDAFDRWKKEHESDSDSKDAIRRVKMAGKAHELATRRIGDIARIRQEHDEECDFRVRSNPKHGGPDWHPDEDLGIALHNQMDKFRSMDRNFSWEWKKFLSGR